MADFTNRATLSYKGISTDSNTVTGVLQEVLTAGKRAVVDTYGPGEKLTYAINIVNVGEMGFNGLRVADNLGGYDNAGTTLYPLQYVDKSVHLFINGTEMTAPAVTAGPPVEFTGINLPAKSEAVLLYQAEVTAFAPLDTGGTILNKATISGGGLSKNVEVTETVATREEPILSISKAISPNVVTENGTITYTFTLHNFGKTGAVADDDVVVTDTFDPILSDLIVRFQGVDWVKDTDYTYSAQGEFASVAQKITVDAATFARGVDGKWVVTPGTATLTVSGTV